MANVAEKDDSAFFKGMENLLGMDVKAVESLITRIDVQSLTALIDAVTNEDRDAAESIVGSFDTDEDVNPLFRGSDIDNKEPEKHKKLKRASKQHQYSFGDSVYIMQRDEKGKKKYIGATVYKPQAPHNTVGIKIDGKPKMINPNRIYIEEGVLGLLGVPTLQRMQQLAGLQSSGLEPDTGVQVEEIPPGAGAGDSASQQAMSALDALEQALPNVRLADLKDIRQRIISIQTCMNESTVPGMGREKKV